MSERVLVPGGAGFIGSHVVDDLIELGCDVIVLDDLSGGFKENVHPEAKFIQGSVNDEKLVLQRKVRVFWAISGGCVLLVPPDTGAKRRLPSVTIMMRQLHPII